MRFRKEKVSSAINYIAEFVRHTATTELRIREDGTHDPVDDRNDHLRELVLIYLSYHFRVAFPSEHRQVEVIIENQEIRQIYEHLVRAAKAHEQVMGLE